MKRVTRKQSDDIGKFIVGVLFVIGWAVIVFVSSFLQECR